MLTDTLALLTLGSLILLLIVVNLQIRAITRIEKQTKRRK